MYINRIYRAAAFAALLLYCSTALAATKTWTGNAADVKQISTITVANTWATNDTATITVNGKALVVTIGANVTTAQVATAIKDAWNAGSRLDATGSTDATSNFGGQEFGEFCEAIASVSGSVVTIVANQAGVPITIAVTENTAGSGTATLATAQTATGKNFWSNVKNWDTGTVPVDDDVVVFKDSDVSCKYGLPNATLEVTFNVYQTFVGEIGLPPTNVDNAAKPYPEYRQRYVRLDDAGGGTNIAHRFGIGRQGTGSPLINIRHATVKCSPIVYNTGQPLPTRPGTYALNLCCTANTSTIDILAGSVDFSSQDGATAAFVAVNQTGGQARCIGGIHTTAALVVVNGGQLLVGQTGAIEQFQTYGGDLRIENQTGTVAGIQIFGGTVHYASTATISNLIIQAANGVFDARDATGAFTVTVAELYAGASYLDPLGRTVAPSNFTLYFDPSERLQFGSNVINAAKIILP